MVFKTGFTLFTTYICAKQAHSTSQPTSPGRLLGGAGRLPPGKRFPPIAKGSLTMISSSSSVSVPVSVSGDVSSSSSLTIGGTNLLYCTIGGGRCAPGRCCPTGRLLCSYDRGERRRGETVRKRRRKNGREMEGGRWKDEEGKMGAREKR